MLTSDLLVKARALYPHTAQKHIYLNHASTGPLSTRVLAAITSHLNERSSGMIDNYRDDVRLVSECRLFVSQLINAGSPDRITFQANTSDAINIVASGIPWKTGDRILLYHREFPANVYPYLNLKRLGVELDFIDAPSGVVSPEMIASGIAPRTRLVALSAVQFLSGHRANLAVIGDLCRSHGVVFAVDGIQAVGAVEIDVQKMGIDAFAAGAQKWLMGPHGIAFLYLTEELQSAIRQPILGWRAVQDPWQFNNYEQPLASSARRYEGGSLNMPGLWGMHAAIGTLLEIGTSAVEDQVLHITGLLRDGLESIDGFSVITPKDRAERAGIITAQLPSNADPKTILKMLQQSKIFPALREGKIRYSPHFYCTPEEMATTVQATEDCLASIVH